MVSSRCIHCFYPLLNHFMIRQPEKPTRKAFVRASTLSLGSIALGSLIVAIFDIIRLILSAVRQAAVDDGNR